MTQNIMKYSAGNNDFYYAALTIDVEDGINIAMNDFFKIKMEPTSRVEKNIDTILEICHQNNVRGTFFVLGEIALSFPGIVRRIDSDGHEIGIHGLHHDQIYKLTPQKLTSDLKMSKDLIENITGKKVLGFRAPAFSINSSTSWALDTLAECGIEYDSSIYPSLSPRYGWKGFPYEISRLSLNNDHSLIEVPLSVSTFMGRTFPVCGGGYLRYYPYALTRNAFRSISRKRPVIIYMHPYELDPEKYPDFFYTAREKAGLRQKLPLMFYRLNKNTVKDKLHSLTTEFKFMPLHILIKELKKFELISEIRLDDYKEN